MPPRVPPHLCGSPHHVQPSSGSHVLQGKCVRATERKEEEGQEQRMSSQERPGDLCTWRCMERELHKHTPNQCFRAHPAKSLYLPADVKEMLTMCQALC